MQLPDSDQYSSTDRTSSIL